MSVVKGTSLISSHQYSVQHFYKVFFFIPILFPLLPLRFHFSLIFFSSILLYYISIPVLQKTHAVLDCVFSIIVDMNYLDYACKLFTGKLALVRVNIKFVRYFISKYLPLNQYLSLLVWFCVCFVSL